MNRLVKNLNKILKPATNTRANKTKRRGRRNRVGRPRSQPQRTAALPAAYASHVSPRFQIISRTANSCTISGCDLVYPIPAQLQSNGDILFAVIPSNPAYWLGTRISQMAPAYMNFRPISFRVSYIPQVAVTQQGTVFMGTFWNAAAPEENLQQSLFTSNGGMLTQCYVPADTTVKLGQNLQQRLFTMNDSLNTDTSPFVFMAGVRGSPVVPGYFYVSYTYEFRNPIGSAWTYYVSQPVEVAQSILLPKYRNMSVILLNQDGDFGPGTILDFEDDGTFSYHGSPVQLSNSTSIQIFANEQSSLTTRLSKSALSYSSVRYGNDQINFNQFMPVAPATTINIPPDNSVLLIQNPESTSSSVQAIFTINNGSSATTITAPGTGGFRYYYYVFDVATTSPVRFVTVDGHNGPGVADSGQSGSSTLYLPNGSLVGLRA